MSNSRLKAMPLSPALRLFIVFIAVIICAVLFLTWDVKASWEFTLPFRGKKLATLILVGIAISVATLLFQTIANNRILTPGIMGFDALYMLIQAMLILILGIIGFGTLNPYIQWLMEAGIMIGCMLLLFRLLFRGTEHSLHLLMLTGIILGVLFSSISGLVFRILDPMEFTVLQDALFATFSAVKAELLTLSWGILLFALILLWRTHHQLDVMLLGQDRASSLGVEHDKLALWMLILIAVLISLSTALVGPVSFFGLIVVHLTYRLAGTYQHRFLIPFAALLGIFVLVAGEWVLQHIFSFNTRLSMIIEFLGGLFFLVLIVKQGKA